MSLLKLVKQHQFLPEHDLSSIESMSDDILWGTLIDHYHIPEKALLKLSSNTLQIPLKLLTALHSDPQLVTSYSPSILKKYRFFPLYTDQETLAISTDNPYRPLPKEEGGGKKIKKVLISKAELDHLLDRLIPPDTHDQTILSQLIEEASRHNASDIHLHQKKGSLSLSFRQEGQIRHIKEWLPKEATSLINSIKYHAHMDISTTQHPQDGHMEIKTDTNTLNIRVSTIPTIYGEDLVLRLLNTATTRYKLTHLGLHDSTYQLFKKRLHCPSGLILITGATGTGKTTTLYSCLEFLREQNRGPIVTLEDPVETHLEGIRQSQINLKANYSFKKGLKALLRQDPKVIMIGEIRDQETAKIALEAAFTGHLVLSSLHTADVKTTLFRLANFDLDPLMISEALKGILSQQLILNPDHPKGVHSRTLLSELFIPPDHYTTTNPLESIDSLLNKGKFISFDEDYKIKFKTDIVFEKS